MNNALVVLDHILSTDSINDLKKVWDIEDIKYIPDNLKFIWKRIDPEYTKLHLQAELKSIIVFIQANRKQYKIIVIDGNNPCVCYIIFQIRHLYPDEFKFLYPLYEKLEIFRDGYIDYENRLVAFIEYKGIRCEG